MPKNYRDLTTASSFDEKFKSSIRDYYSYGFEIFTTIGKKSSKTISEDWRRLSNILGQGKYLKWYKGYRKARYANADAELLDNNPFANVYRHCNIRQTNIFLHSMAALSTNVALTDNVFVWNDDDAFRSSRNNEAKAYKSIQAFKKTGKGYLKTSSLLFFYDAEMEGKDVFDYNKTYNERLGVLARLGFLEGKQEGIGDHYWKLPACTLKMLLDAGDDGLQERLFHALSFYSRYHTFGELGSFILDRLMEKKKESLFFFKHDYLMSIVNDFNRIDLLEAIEERKWCLISYRKNLADFETMLLCYPLQLRSSCSSGRENVIIYNPLKRSCSSLRLEFIDKILYYNDADIKAFLESTVWGDSSPTINPSPLNCNEIEEDIKKAHALKDFSWGVSTNFVQDNNLIQGEDLKIIKLAISFDPVKEPYILRRLERECRHGKISSSEDGRELHFEIPTYDPTELRPWLRSFYARLLSCEGMDTPDFSVSKDVKAMNELYEKNRFAPSDSKAKKIWSLKNDDGVDIYAALVNSLGKGEAANAHEGLFNEYLSLYTQVMAELFLKIAKEMNQNASLEFDVFKRARQLIRNSKYAWLFGEDTDYEILQAFRYFFEDKGFFQYVRININGESKLAEKPIYRIKPEISNFYRDIVPLSFAELRWLKTVIQDRRIKCFLLPQDIDTIEGFLESTGVKAFPMEHLYTYDLYKVDEIQYEKEQQWLPVIIEAIETQREIRISYISRQGNSSDLLLRPIVIDYSKRNNVFQLYAYNQADEKFYMLNIGQIEAIQLTECYFDWTAMKESLEKWWENNYSQVEVEFPNVRNLPDRILNEFSPWKKECSYDNHSKLYRLKLYYQKNDETDVVIRLMGYGKQIRIADRKHPIYQEIKQRIAKQLEIMRPLEREGAYDYEK